MVEKAAIFLMILGVVSFLRYGFGVWMYEKDSHEKSDKDPNRYNIENHEADQMSLRNYKFFRALGVCEFVIGFILFLINF